MNKRCKDIAESWFFSANRRFSKRKINRPTGLAFNVEWTLLYVEPSLWLPRQIHLRHPTILPNMVNHTLLGQQLNTLTAYTSFGAVTFTSAQCTAGYSLSTHDENINSNVMFIIFRITINLIILILVWFLFFSIELSLYDKTWIIKRSMIHG